MASGRLAGRVAIVTGGSGGIGSEVARAFAREGAHVIVHYSRSRVKAEAVAKEIREKCGVKCEAFGADASKHEEIKQLVDSVAKKYGRVDILANFLGFPVSKETADYWKAPFEKTSLKMYEDVLRIDLFGTILFCQAVIPHMKRQKYGKVINVSANIALSGWVQGHPFAAAKGAILALSKGLAQEFASHKINVNIIAPGSIKTRWVETLTPAERKAEEESAPLKRWGVPADIAGAALFLASDESSFMTGQVLIVDGGAVMR